MTSVDLRWRAAPLTRSLAMCAGVAVVAALVTGRWELIAFAAPLLGILCTVGRQPPPPVVEVTGEPAVQRCFEGDEVQVRLSAIVTEADGAQCAVPVRAATVDGMELTDRGQGPAPEVGVRAARWGRYPVAGSVRVLARGALLEGIGTAPAAEVSVFPVAPPQATPIPRTELLDRLGTHLTRHIGPGVEYADIRPYVPGDQLRTVNWTVSARRGALHVTQRLTDRAADVVLFDTYPQPPGPATAAMERTARGAAQVVQSALRSGDRAGLVALGARGIRWLGADIGQRQFYRILDTMLGASPDPDAGDSYERAVGTLAPRPALPTGAIVVAFSTLLDTEFALALIDLRKRGHAVLVVDVLLGSPLDQQRDPLVDRMWSMQRSFMYRDMATVGVDVVAWPDTVALDEAMALVPDRRRGVRR